MFTWYSAHIQKLKICAYVFNDCARAAESIAENLKYITTFMLPKQFFDGFGQDEKRAFKKFWPFKNGNEKDESRKSLELFSVRILKFDF